MAPSQQVAPVGMGGESGDHRNVEPVHVIGELVLKREKLQA
jgi:hypothetical protein